MKNYGIASLFTDTGHNSSAWDAAWAYDNEETRQDWGHRALHPSTTIGKRVITSYYVKDIGHSYYAGVSECSAKCFL